METLQILGTQLWKRIGRSVEIVEERLRRTVAVLEKAGIPYAVVGGNAVRIRVAQIDEGAVSATNDVDMIQVGLIDSSWLGRFPGELRRRLQSPIDNPDQ